MASLTSSLEEEDIASWIVLSTSTTALESKLEIAVRDVETLSAWMGLSSVDVVTIEVSNDRSTWVVWRSLHDVQRFIKEFASAIPPPHSKLEEMASHSTTEITSQNDRIHLEHSLRAIASSDLSSENPKIRAFFVETATDKSSSTTLSPLLRLSRDIIARHVCRHLSHMDIVRLERTCKHLNFSCNEKRVWQHKGFIFLSSSFPQNNPNNNKGGKTTTTTSSCHHHRHRCRDEGGVGFLQDSLLLEPTTVTIMVHGEWDALPRLLMKSSIYPLLPPPPKEMVVSTRVSHSLVNIRFVRAIGADERGAEGRILILKDKSELEDLKNEEEKKLQKEEEEEKIKGGGDGHRKEEEEWVLLLKARTHLPQAVIVVENETDKTKQGGGKGLDVDDDDEEEGGGEEVLASVQGDAALSSLLKAIVSPSVPDEEVTPYSLADYIGVLQFAAKTASKAFLLMPAKLAPAIVVFGLATGAGLPTSLFSFGGSISSLAVRAIWMYPSISLTGGAVYGALIASPPVGRIHQNKWVKWVKRVTDFV